MLTGELENKTTLSFPKQAVALQIKLDFNNELLKTIYDYNIAQYYINYKLLYHSIYVFPGLFVIL